MIFNDTPILLIGGMSMEQKIEQLLEDLENEDMAIVEKKGLLNGMNIEYIFIGIVLLLVFSNSNKNDSCLPFTLKLDENDPEETYEKITRMNHMVKDVMPYFGFNMRNMFKGIESLLNIAENVYGLNSGINKKKVQAMGEIDIPKKPIKILEAASPYLKGTGKENIDKFLTINNKIEKLQNNKNSNLLENGKEVLDIMDLVNIKQARDIKQKITTIGTLMNLINQ